MKGIKNLLSFVLAVVVLAIVLVGCVRAFMVLNVRDNIITCYDIRTSFNPEESEPEYDAVIVLGAGVYADGSLSPMLQYRLDKAIEVYETGDVRTVFVSGDHREGEYDEVDHMTEYLIQNGIPEGVIAYDYNGFSTYESIYRAIHTYGITKAIVVTQEYHLYRALFDAKSYDVEFAGVSAENVKFSTGNVIREGREWIACIHDLYQCIIKQEVTDSGIAE